MSRAESMVTDKPAIQEMAKSVLQDVIEHVLDCVTEDEAIMAKKFPQRVTSEQSKNHLAFEQESRNSETRANSTNNKNKSIINIKKRVFTKNRLDSSSFMVGSTKNSSQKSSTEA